jgi:hypothetical protein
VSLADDLTPAEPVRRDRPQHPAGWEPGIAWNGQTGTITSRPIAEPGPNWDELLRVWGFDPANVEIVEPVQVRTWDAAVGNGETRTMWYYRAGVTARRADAPDVSALIEEIRRHRSTKRAVSPAAEQGGSAERPGAFVYCAADWQAGKKGTEAMTARVLASFDAAAARVKELRRIGRTIDAIYFLGLGDLTEGCKDHYAMQTFEVEMDNRAQVRLARRLVIKGVEVLAPLVPRMVAAGIGGNHGEERHDGKAYTTFADNKDVAAVEQAAEVIRAAPAYQHVSFVIPEEQLTITLDVGGLIVGMAHGHQARRGGVPQQKVREWWKDQAFGRRPVGDADLLLTGHYHHLSILSDGGRTHMQAPTMDSGSQWWEESAGMPTTPAALTFMVQGGRWQDIQLL